MSLQLDHVTNINQGFQDGRPAWTELTLQVMMTSSQLGYINYVCGIIFTPLNPTTTKLYRKNIQYAIITLSCHDGDVITNMSPD